MKVIFYFNVLCQVLNVLGSTNSINKGNCIKTVHQEPFFMKELCKSNQNMNEFMIAADIMLRSDCFLMDSCRRITDQHIDDLHEVDFIVVGGGVAGPVVAGRLSENPNWTVVLLESGSEQPVATDIPAFLTSAIGTKYDWQYATTPQKNACLAFGGVCGWPRGKLLGGTAALSGSMYSRGHRDVYDSWLRDGNIGWGYDDVLPYFKKSENNKDYNSGQSLKIHGTNGPIIVQKPTEILPITKSLIEAGKELGYQSIDMSEPDPYGFSIAQIMINNMKSRMTMPTAFLRPHINSRSNLKVKINSHVTRLLVDAEKKTVYGVEYVDKMNNTKKLLARKEVILSAGVIGSPHILMLSGIGPEEDLAPLGIPIVQNLRVGHNLQHHVASKLSFQLNVTHNRLLTFEALGQYLKHRTGPLATTGGLQTSAFLKSDQIGPNEPADVQLFFDGFSPSCEYSQPRTGCSKPNYLVKMNVRPVNIRPKSKGTIKLVSSDPFVRPLINPNYLSVESDENVLVWGLKLAIDVFNTKSLQKYEPKVDSTVVEHCKSYAFATKPYWRCLVKYYTRGENHHAGTCKMGPASDPNAVVDSELKVHNVKGVRVVDASIMPLQPNSNPIAPIVMVAEKASQYIKNSWH